MTREPILVIGEDMAGLAAARQLVWDGFHVLEARSRLGGRICTTYGTTKGMRELQWLVISG
jgi:monoamine oxidase